MEIRNTHFFNILDKCWRSQRNKFLENICSLFTVAWTSHSTVINSSKLRIEMLSVLNKIFLTQQITRFHHPVHQRAVERVNFYLMGDRSLRETTIGFWSKDFKRLFVNLNLVTLSLYMLDGLSLQHINRQSVWMKPSFEIFDMNFKCTTLCTAHTKSTIHTLDLFFKKIERHRSMHKASNT